MTAPFNFQLADNLMSGVGSTTQIPTLLTKHGYHRVTVLVDEAVADKSPYFAKMVAVIEQSGPLVAIRKLRGTEEPDYAYLDTIVADVRAQPMPDVLIGIGGGSSMDIT